MLEFPRRRFGAAPRVAACVLLVAAASACDPEFEDVATWPSPGPATPKAWISAESTLARVMVSSMDTGTPTSRLTCLDADGTFLGDATLSAPWKFGALDRDPTIQAGGYSHHWAWAEYQQGATHLGFLIEFDSECNAQQLVSAAVPLNQGSVQAQGIAADDHGNLFLGLTRNPTDVQSYDHQLWRYDGASGTWSEAAVSPPFAGPILLYGAAATTNDVNFDVGLDEVVAGSGGSQRRYDSTTLASLGTRSLSNPANSYTAAWDVWWGYTVQVRRSTLFVGGFYPSDTLLLHDADGNLMESHGAGSGSLGLDLARHFVDDEPPYLSFLIYREQGGGFGFPAAPVLAEKKIVAYPP